MRKYVSLFLSFCLLFATGCQNDGAEDPVLSDRMKTQLSLSALKDAMPFRSDKTLWGADWRENVFGITGREACIEQLYGYYWQPDGGESVEDRSGQWALLFSGPVWGSDSVCVGIALNPNAIFTTHGFRDDDSLWEWADEEISVRAVKAYLGDRVGWVGPKRAADPYYLFQEDFGVWKMFTNQDGSRIRTDLPILVQPEDVECDLRNLPLWDDGDGYTSEAWREVYENPASARTGAPWDAINGYINMLDKARKEILDDYTITEYYGERYQDNKTGALFTFNSEGKSSRIRISIGSVFPELSKRDKDGLLFFEEMGLPAEWGENDTRSGRAFHYYFDDGRIVSFLAAGDDMNLTKDDWVVIK
jgi:hypothetical protein